jgi:RimJ/RimL family protein N-acetyltransferase
MSPLSLEFGTDRLRLREFVMDDAAFILRLLNEPSFIEFIGDRGVRTLQDAERYLREGPLSSYRQYGHGLLRVSLKDGDIPIGMCGLVKRDTLPHPDIGFALLPAFWDQGFVTETARVVMQHGREALGIQVVLGITTPGNARSIAVLQKLGLSFLEQKPLGDRPEPLKIFGLSVESAP